MSAGGCAESSRSTPSNPRRSPTVGGSPACSAIHCCFVYVSVELRVSSSVSHQWLCTSDAPLSSSGSRWPRFPAFNGTIRALRLPSPACPSAHCFRQPAPRLPAGVRVRLAALPPPYRPGDGPGVADNCKSPICGNRKLHTLIAGVSTPVQAVGKINRNRAEHRCTDGRQCCC